MKDVSLQVSTECAADVSGACIVKTELASFGFVERQHIVFNQLPLDAEILRNWTAHQIGPSMRQATDALMEAARVIAKLAEPPQVWLDRW